MRGRGCACVCERGCARAVRRGGRGAVLAAGAGRRRQRRRELGKGACCAPDDARGALAGRRVRRLKQARVGKTHLAGVGAVPRFERVRVFRSAAFSLSPHAFTGLFTFGKTRPGARPSSLVPTPPTGRPAPHQSGPAPPVRHPRHAPNKGVLPSLPIQNNNACGVRSGPPRWPGSRRDAPWGRAGRPRPGPAIPAGAQGLDPCIGR